jgi:NADH:ubiquinone oxidoreductase subunit 6 (subunit J)
MIRIPTSSSRIGSRVSSARLRARFAIGLRAGAIGLAVAAIVAAGARAAAAETLTSEPCPPLVAKAREGLPPGSTVTCRVHRSENRTIGNQTIAGTIDILKVDVVYPNGRLATLDLVPPPPPDKPVPVALSPTEKAITTPGAVRSTTFEHGDLNGSSGKGMALAFWVFAAITVVGALFVVSRRNLIAAVMGMVGSFLGIAAVYMMLYARFLAVVQLLVYAGAIMVLFVFVVMILNRPEDEPVAPSGRAGQALGSLAILYLVVRLVMLLVHVEPPNPETAMAAPQGVNMCTVWKDKSCARSERLDWGSVGAVGTDLFNAGLFPFAALSRGLRRAGGGARAPARPVGPEDERARQRMEGGVA